MNFLDRVVVEKREEVAARRAARPVRELEAAAADQPVRDFRTAVSGPGINVIAELKARTPSIQRFRQSENLDELAKVYEENGARAISVVVDTKNFGTSLEHLRRAREHTNLPAIAKEFVIDPYQVLEARAAGADAILLIARLLEWDALTGLLDFAGQLGMTALVETHDEREMKTALQARAAVVGVNNRDLDTMTVSLDTTRRLARLVPDGVTLVAESGIHTRADIDDLASHGARAFLIGGSLLNAEDPGALLRELTK